MIEVKKIKSSSKNASSPNKLKRMRQKRVLKSPLESAHKSQSNHREPRGHQKKKKNRSSIFQETKMGSLVTAIRFILPKTEASHSLSLSTEKPNLFQG